MFLEFICICIYGNIYLYVISVFIFSCIQDTDQFTVASGNFRVSYSVNWYFHCGESMTTGFCFWNHFFSHCTVVRTCYWTVLMLGSKAQSMSPMSLTHLVIGFKGLPLPCCLSSAQPGSPCTPLGPSVHLPGGLFLQVAQASWIPCKESNTIRCQTQGLNAAIPVILL